MKILILGSDGYLGRPATLHFSELGHETKAIDDFSKRKIIKECNCGSLIETSPHGSFSSVLDFEHLRNIIIRFNPNTIIHYAEQPSAPYSMLDIGKASYTIQNNLIGTLNLIHAINEINPDIHLIKFGSMGEYGTPNIDIEEGYLTVEHKNRKHRFLYPRTPGSLYHATKVFDTDLLAFYVRQWNLKVTDIMQGVVYGVTTPEIEKYDIPTNFYYDEIFGTAINRFVVQAIIGHPLTIYGSGNQQRTFLNLNDVLACLDLVIEHPACKGKMQIINQFTEKMSIIELADMVRKTANDDFGLDPKIDHKDNLRQESQQHYYNVNRDILTKWGLKSRSMYHDGELKKMFETLMPYKNRIDENIIYNGVRWKK